MKTWKTIILLSYISIASASAAILTPALPQIQKTLNLNHGLLEWIVSIFLVGYMLGQLVYGPLANRIGRLSALRTGFIINLFGIGICLFGSYMNSYQSIIVGRFVTALGASAGLSCTFILLNESLSPTRAKHFLSFAIVSFTAGIGLAVLLGGIITQYLQWQDCFWLLLIHGIAMLCTTYLFQETLASTKKLSFVTLLKDYTQALGHTKLLTFSLFVGFVSLYSYCYSAAAPIIAQKLLDLSAAEYGYWNILNMVGMLIGAIAASRLLKKYNNLSIILIGTAFIIVGMMALAFLAINNILNTFTFFPITTMMYFMASLIFPSASHIASNAISDKANAAGAMNLINMGAAVLGVGIMGYLPMESLWAFISVTVIFAILCIVAMLVSIKKSKELIE